MIVNKLLETLKVAEVKIDFRSLVSERNITAPCTLREDRIPNHFNIKQSIKKRHIVRKFFNKF